MGEIEVRKFADCAPYEGPDAIPGIRFRPVGPALGVSGWGMNLLELDAGCTGYPEHDYAADGQEEPYVVLEGSAELRTAAARR
ncbi:MAG: hypothetical protein R3F30_00295 [Planctomycetota bacterium]